MRDAQPLLSEGASCHLMSAQSAYRNNTNLLDLCLLFFCVLLTPVRIHFARIVPAFCDSGTFATYSLVVDWTVEDANCENCFLCMRRIASSLSVKTMNITNKTNNHHQSHWNPISFRLLPFVDHNRTHTTTPSTNWYQLQRLSYQQSTIQKRKESKLQL